MNNEQVQYMVNRFLGWRLPKYFNPDCGISFERTNGVFRYENMPVGTNLLTAQQAEEMVKYLIDGLPEPKG